MVWLYLSLYDVICCLDGIKGVDVHVIKWNIGNSIVLWMVGGNGIVLWMVGGNGSVLWMVW